MTTPRAIALYCNLVADAVIDGIGESQAALGIDIGELEDAPVEPALAEEEGAQDAAAPVEPPAEGAAEQASA